MAQPIELGEAEVSQPAKVPILPVRIAKVFTSPTDLFDSLRERPVWIAALLVLIGLGLAQQLLIPEEIRRMIIEQTMERFIPAGTDPAAVEAQIEAAVNPPPIQTVLASLFVTPIVLLIISGLLLLAFNVVMGGEGTFKRLFSASVHAFYVYTLGGIVVLGLMFLGSAQMVLSPGVFLPDSADGFVAHFLNGINVFSVWTCVTLGIAVSRIYPERSVAAGAGYLLTLYLLSIAGLAGFAGLIG